MQNIKRLGLIVMADATCRLIILRDILGLVMDGGRSNAGRKLAARVTGVSPFIAGNAG